MRKTLAVMAIIVLIAVTGSSAWAYQSHFGPTELTYYDQTKSYNGYTLFTPFANNITYLIDMQGNLINYWPCPDGWSIEKYTYFLDNGNLLRRIKTSTSQRLQEMDWDGNLIYDIVDTRPEYTHHHDFVKIWNKKLQAYTFLSVATKKITHAQAIARGADPKKRADYTSTPDGIIEFDLKGNVIWEWNIFDHLVQDIDPTKANYGVVKDNFQKMDVNFGAGRSGDWIHINSLDYNETLDQIVLNNSRDSEFYVIDHGATFIPGNPANSIALAAGAKGDFVYRWGNPTVYDSGAGNSYAEATGASDGDQQVFFSHDIQWIPQTFYPGGPALPGAGNFLIFDNGTRHVATGFAYSALIEINPYNGPMANGAYVRQETAGYKNIPVYQGNRRTSNQVAWFYASKDPASFWSRHISGVQRLPNGNTTACLGTWGVLFEVTPAGEVVWEYKVPVANNIGIVKTLKDGDSQQSFRAYRYGPDHPALRGKELVPQGPLTAPTLFTGFGFGSGAGDIGAGGAAGTAGGGGGY